MSTMGRFLSQNSLQEGKSEAVSHGEDQEERTSGGKKKRRSWLHKLSNYYSQELGGAEHCARGITSFGPGFEAGNQCHYLHFTAGKIEAQRTGDVFLNLSVLAEPRLRSLSWPPGLPLPGWGLSGDSEKVWKHKAPYPLTSRAAP